MGREMLPNGSPSPGGYLFVDPFRVLNTGIANVLSRCSEFAGLAVGVFSCDRGGHNVQAPCFIDGR